MKHTNIMAEIAKMFIMSLSILAVGTVLGTEVYLTMLKSSSTVSGIKENAETLFSPQLQEVSINSDGWETYASIDYGFNIEYPGMMYAPGNPTNGTVLLSVSNTDIGQGSIADLTVKAEKNKKTAKENAEAAVKNLPSNMIGLGPEEKSIADTNVYFDEIKTANGLKGVSRIYYFPNFNLTFIYATDSTASSMLEIEQGILGRMRVK